MIPAIVSECDLMLQTKQAAIHPMKAINHEPLHDPLCVKEHECFLFKWSSLMGEGTEIQSYHVPEPLSMLI